MDRGVLFLDMGAIFLDMGVHFLDMNNLCWVVQDKSWVGLDSPILIYTESSSEELFRFKYLKGHHRVCALHALFLYCLLF